MGFDSFFKNMWVVYLQLSLFGQIAHEKDI